jgi:nucleoside-diphosphate-sugar epimerase
MKILVTGANGFIGSSLCKELAEADHKVRAAVRRGMPLQNAHANIEFMTVGDIGSETDWTLALKGIDVIIHLAARAHMMTDTSDNPISEYRRINVEGTRRLAGAAVQAGVKRFVYLSSIKVNGEATMGNAFREDDIPAPEDPYGLSKWETELVLRDILEKNDMGITIIRPPLVYGPGVKGNLLRLMQYVDRGFPLPLKGINNRRSLISLDNLVEILGLAASDALFLNQTLLVSDGEDVSTPDLVYAIAEAMGKKARLIKFPERLVSVVTSLFPPLKPTVDRLTGSLIIDSSRLRTGLNWSPRRSFKDGIEAMVSHFLSTKMNAC